MITILTGRQTDPLQEKILDRAAQDYLSHPELETFIIVPNHIKFNTEVAAITKVAQQKHQTKTSVRDLHVLSFSRLAWYFLKKADIGLPAKLDDAAASMLLEDIIQKHKEELLLFKNMHVNPGMLNQLYQTVLQVYGGNLDLNTINLESADLETKNKIHDLKIIYDDFIQEISGKFATKDEVIVKLNEVLVKSNLLSNSIFYFTDFSHFSLQEKKTIQLIAMQAQKLTMAFKTEAGDLKDTQEGDYDYVIQNTIKSLTGFFDRHNLSWINEALPINSTLTPKERLNGLWSGAIAAKDDERLNNVQLIRADTRYAEAYFAARTIYQQVALNHYRYRDFLILAPNLQEYETYLTPILRQNDIPYFNDLQQQMKYHPLVILIENLASLLKVPNQTGCILAIMKTRLIIPANYQDEAKYLYDVDELENFVLAHGIDHTLWKKNFTDFVDAKSIDLDNRGEKIAELDNLRQFFVTEINNLLKKLKKEKDSQKALKIFFDFLISTGVADRLEKWRDSANEAGDLQQAQQPEQTWDLLISLMQDYLLIRPEFNAESFFQMMIAAFREATFSTIPSTLDAVNISELGMVQSPNYKQVFILGASSGNLPQIQKTPGFLTSENLVQLEDSFNSESYLEDQQELNNLDQNYQFGINMALANDRVYISYPAVNSDNAVLKPSIYYERLMEMGAPEYQQHDLPENSQDLLSFMTNSRASLGYLTYLDKITPSPFLNKLLNLNRRYDKQLTETVIEGIDYDNLPEDIGPDLAQELYGKDLSSSVSQLETFYENSYEYFLTYGLRLHKRSENELDVIQAGNYFHETFDYLVKVLADRHLDLAELDEIALEKLLQEIHHDMQKEGRFRQLLNDPFNEYLFKCLDKTTSCLAQNWRLRQKQTPLKARYSELSFGPSEKVKGITLPLNNLNGSHFVNMRGKIDRVDLFDAPGHAPGHVLGQVIDYKSSRKKFDLGMFANGISLQMVSYLDVLLKNADFFANNRNLDLLGAFYQTVTRSLDRLNSKELITPSMTVKEDELAGKPRLLYNGIIVNDPDILIEAEPFLKHDGQKSNLYSGVKTKARGGFSLPQNANFTEDELDLLLEYDEYLIQKASEEILSGKINLNPYRYGKSDSAQNALTYSDFKDIYFFDAMLENNQYHEIKSMKKGELLSYIRQLLGKEENDG